MINAQLLQQFIEFCKNPSQYAIQYWGIDPAIANDPNAIIQKMMQENKISQYRYNIARQSAYQMQNNPLLSQFFKRI